MEICVVGAALYRRTDGQTDITKFKSAFSIMRMSPKTGTDLRLLNNIQTQGVTISLNLKNSISVLLGSMGSVHLLVLDPHRRDENKVNLWKCLLLLPWRT